MTAREGRVWVFGDNINTDLIISGKYLDNYDPAHLASHAMEGASKEFASQVRRGDMIVAGVNFGCGSSREQAVIALKHAGVNAVVAESFARIFYRNAINLGLPVYVSVGVSAAFMDGEMVILDSESSRIHSKDGRSQKQFDPMPERLRAITEAGGLIPYLRGRMQMSQKGSRRKG